MAKPRGAKNPPTTIRNCTAEITAPIVEMSRWMKIDTNDPAQVQARIDEYFDYCIRYDLRPSVEMLATALKVTNSTLYQWQKKSGWRGEMIGNAKATINAILSEMALNNMVNPTTLIWFQKNHEGYRDNVTIETHQATGLDALPSREDILKRLPKEPDDEVIEEGEFKEIDGEESEGSDRNEAGK